MGACAAADTTRAFPRDKPTHATGKGAIVGATTGSCAAGGTLISTIAANDVPGPPTPLRSPDGARLTLRPPLALAPAPHGRLVIAGSAPATGGSGQLVQGSAGGPFATLGTIAGAASQNALATGYLGDLAAASPTGGGSGRAGVRVDVERYFAGALSPSRIVAAQPGALSALTVALNFRSDALAVWAQGGSLYARELPATSAPHPIERLGPGTPAGARIAAVLTTTTARSSPGPTGMPARPASTSRDPPPACAWRAPLARTLSRSARPARLRRLAPARPPVLGERDDGLDGRPSRPLGRPHRGDRPPRCARHQHDLPSRRDALLADLAPGPDGEALALWAEPQPSPVGLDLDLDRQAIFAARGFDAYPGRTVFAAGEQVAPPGPNSGATIALDPDTDRAIAVWRTGAGAIAYAIRAPGAP